MFLKTSYHLCHGFFDNPLSFDGISLYQIGRMYCEKDTVIDEHIHTTLFELTVVTEGEGSIFANKTPTAVKRGDIYFSFPCDTHEIISSQENPLKYDFIAFAPTDETLINEFEKIVQNYYSPHSRVFHDERIRQIVTNALAEIQEKKMLSQQLLSALFRQLVIYIIRDFQDIKRNKNDDKKAATAAEILCYKLMNYIDTHVFSMKNLEETAQVLGYSYSYLSTLFKKTTGNTLSHYFNEKRMDVARLLILENEMKITEISELLNYSSLYAFSKAFRNKYQLSPRSYRKKHTD